VTCLFSVLATSLITVGCGPKSIATPYVAEEFQICTNASDQLDPSISGDIVAWLDRRNNNSNVFDIYGYKLSSGHEFPVCIDAYNKFDLIVEGNTIGWFEPSRGVSGDGLGFYNISSGFAQVIGPYYPSEVEEVYRVSENDSVITCTGRIICTGPSAQHLGICNQSNEPASYAVSGDTLIWQDRRNSNWDIFGYNSFSGQEFAVCTLPGNQSQPAIAGPIVVWTDERNGNLDIYGYNLSARQEFPICTNAGNQTSPAISGNTVVWVDDRNGNFDIYGARLTFDNK
jgi:beta propeller repeat protein